MGETRSAGVGLDDPYTIPQVRDSYSSLFWMDYCDRHLPGGEADDRSQYPYLGWATDHFHGGKQSPSATATTRSPGKPMPARPTTRALRSSIPSMSAARPAPAHMARRRGLLARVVRDPGKVAHGSTARPAGRHREDAYLYRADRSEISNPPESGILLMQYANLPFDEPPAAHRAKTASVLAGLLWEEVRPIRRVEMIWMDPVSADGKKQPGPEEIELFCFDATDDTAHTWWNPRSVKSCGKPEVSADRRTYRWNVPVDTWAVVAALRDGKAASGYAAPTTIAAKTPEVWKVMDLEIQWGFDNATAAADYSGMAMVYGGWLGEVRPLAGDAATVGSFSSVGRVSAWRSVGPGNLKSLGRPYRGVRMSVATRAPRGGGGCGRITPSRRMWPGRS